MNPGSGNLDIYRGDTKRWQFKLWSDLKRTVPADLSGAIATATIRDKAVGGTFQLLLTCTVSSNIIDMSLTATQSRTLPATGVWDLQLTYPSGDIFTVLRGNVIVTQDVTHSDVVVQPLARVK
jgi:hypothetical protein